MSQPLVNSALLVVGIQNDFTRENGKYPIDRTQSDEIIENINKIINSL